MENIFFFDKGETLKTFISHSIEEICTSIAKITGVRIPTIVAPAWILKSVATIIMLIGRSVRNPLMGIHPDRIDKLMVSTNIIGDKLQLDYPLQYNLDEAILDWFIDCDRKGLF